MKLILQLVAIVACLLLLIQVFYGLFRYYHGDVKLSHGRTIANWVILIVMLLAWGGSHYLGNDEAGSSSHFRIFKMAKISHHSKKTTKHSESKESGQAAPKISFKKEVTLDKNGQAMVKFSVPANSALQIVDSHNRVLLGTQNPSADGAMEVDYNFAQDGTYQIIGMRNKKQTKKQLTVKKAGNPDNNQNADNKNNNNNNNNNDNGTHIEYRRTLVPIK